MAGTGSAEGNTFFGNALLDAPIDPLVPEIIDRAADTVQEYLNQNKTWAQASIDAATATMALLANARFPAEVADPPDIPEMDSTFYTGTGLNFETTPDLGRITPTSIEEFNPEAIIVPDISSEIPEYVPVVTQFYIPDPPTYVPPDHIDPPVLDLEFVEPTPPVAGYGSPPILDELNLPVYVPPVLPVFGEDAPSFDLTPPDPIIQWREPEYVGQVSPEVQAVLEAMLAGGTGIPVATETAIWERARDREAQSAEAGIVAATEEWAARGFSYPPGRLNGQVIALRDAANEKLNGVSREVAIKQADLEQANRQFAVTAGINFEQLFVNIFLAVTGRNFEIAKFQVETQIQVYNLQVTAFNVEQQVFAQKILLYKAQLEAALYDIKAFEALVSAEKAKADMNIAKIQAFDSSVKAFNSQVEAYNSLIKAEIAKAEFEKNKVEIFKAEIEAQVAGIQGQKAAFDAYDSRVKGEAAKAQLEEANAQAYTARVRGIGEKANVLVKEIDAEIAVQRIDLDWAVARLQRITTQSAQELNAMQARLASYQAVNTKAIAKFDAESRSKQAELQAQVEFSRVAVARYSAMLEQWRARTQQVTAFAQINSESLRAAGTIASNLAAGAMAGTHVSAGLSGGASASQSSSRGASDATQRTQTYGESHQFQETQYYPHTPRA
jgi:hypothetical protein